jgi:hypothetical protein
MRLNILDTLGLLYENDVIVAMPSPEYKRANASHYKQAIEDRHPPNHYHVTENSIIFKCVPHLLSLWIPALTGGRVPNRTDLHRRRFVLVSNWYDSWELKRWT